MYPNAPDWKSSAGGAGWLWWVDPVTGKKYLYQSQASTVIRKFQSFGKLALAKQDSDPLTAGMATFSFDASGNCFSGATVDALPAASRASARTVADLSVDGVWTQETADLLGFLLCKSGNAAAARKVAADSVARTFSSETWRLVFWLGNLVTQTDWNWRNTPPVTDAARKLGEGLVIPPGTILPTWGSTAVAGSADTQWVGKSESGAPLPNPPSLGGGTRPWPETTTPNSAPPTGQKASGGWMMWLIAGVVVLMLMSGSGGGGGGGGRRSGGGRTRGLPSRRPVTRDGLVVIKSIRDLPKHKHKAPVRHAPRQIGAPMRQLGAGPSVVVNVAPASAKKASKGRPRSSKPKSAKPAAKKRSKVPLGPRGPQEELSFARGDDRRAAEAKRYGEDLAHLGHTPDWVKMRMRQHFDNRQMQIADHAWEVERARMDAEK